ncbi:UNVERIFIED_CONTAM: hypothetical protein Scaly_2214200 [Sesamum calycinum]|uniref:Uncharacterized protein n=1 Tax=Sesamum calycinum TaxID=2727403 RepID=A0AAW2MP87_9LAMI
MKPEYMFLTMLIPGPSNPERRIDVYSESLIEELLQLWHVGVLMHNHGTNQVFMMREALMWTVNDLPAYGMASGWSTAGIMGALFFLSHDYPYRKNKRSFTKNRQERKIARPRLTGDEIRHRVEEFGTVVEEPLTYLLDVVYIEKNVFDNIFNTVMDIKGKTKDNLNPRKNLKNIYNRPELEVDKCRPNAMPKAAYTLTKEQKKKICEWKLILIAFRELLLKFVRNALNEAQLGQPPQQMEVFASCYKKKDDGSWSGLQAEEVARRNNFGMGFEALTSNVARLWTKDYRTSTSNGVRDRGEKAGLSLCYWVRGIDIKCRSPVDQRPQSINLQSRLAPGTFHLNTASENQAYVRHTLQQDRDQDVVPRPATDY